MPGRWLQPNNGFDPNRYPEPTGEVERMACGRVNLIDNNGETHLGQNEV